jgi:hypothetical protein
MPRGKHAHPSRDSLRQRVGSGLSDGVIVLYAASTHADCTHDLAVEPQRDAAWERDQPTVGHFDVVQRTAGL